MVEIIDNFSGEYDWLSNFYQVDDNLTAEHVYQAAKTMDQNWKRKILKAKTPGKAKRLGQKAPLRPDWNSIRYDIMIHIIREKFKDSIISAKLIKTYPSLLIEGNNWHDNFWGNCECDKCKSKEGLNILGFILMTVRSELLYFGD